MQENAILRSVELRAAMDKLEPPIKYSRVDTLSVLRTKIVDSMRVRELAASSRQESFQQSGEKQALGGVDSDMRDPKRRNTDGGDNSDAVDRSYTLSPVLAQVAPPLPRVSTLQTPVKQQEHDASAPVLHYGQAASAKKHPEGGWGGGSLSLRPSAESKGEGEFTCMHLADVLTAAVCGKLNAMILHVQTLKEKHSAAFKDVKLSENGIKYGREDIPKIAKSIAECKFDAAKNAEELLSWLTVSAKWVVVGHLSCLWNELSLQSFL